MSQQLYDSLIAEYSVGVSNQEDFIPSEHVEGIVEVLEGKTESDISIEDIELVDKSDGSYNIKHPKLDDKSLEIGGSINYSPEGQRCVTKSNQSTGNPPEGSTRDGNGNIKYGIR